MTRNFTFLYFREPSTSVNPLQVSSRLRVLPKGKPARRPIAEVKPCPEGLQLGWVTLKKYPVLYAIFFSVPSPLIFFIFMSDTSDPSSLSLTVSLFFLRS